MKRNVRIRPTTYDHLHTGFPLARYSEYTLSACIDYYPAVRSQTMDFETRIYPRIGGFGRYNRIVAFFSWIPHFAAVLNLFCDIFFTLIPESYHCKPDPSLLPSAFLLSNISEQEYLNFTIPWVEGSGLSHCDLYKYPANFTNLTETLPKEVVHCTQGWEYTHQAGLQSNYVTEVSVQCALHDFM